MGQINIVWTCHICGKTRPDAFISVHTNDLSSKSNLPKGTIKENIRYCNDNEDCSNKVKTFTHFKE